MTENKKIVYCDKRKCPHVECLRHNSNIPFNMLVLRKSFQPDEKWDCKYIVI